MKAMNLSGRTLSVAIALLLFGALALGGAGAVQAADLGQPAFITSAGQSPGALMLRVLADRAGVINKFDAVGTADALDGAGSFIVVIGASMKGLGAAGIDVDEEFDRVRSLLERAKQQGIPVVAAHVEGGPRRGATSDDLTKLAFEYADYAVVRADGDNDGFFSDLAAQHNVTLEKVDATAGVAAVLSTWYGN